MFELTIALSKQSDSCVKQILRIHVFPSSWATGLNAFSVS